MICDQNDFLVKRTGWRTQAQFNAPIYGLFAMPDGVGCAVHAGTKLYFRAPDGTQTELCADMNEAFSQSFMMKGVLYLMDGKTYRVVRKSSKNAAWEAVSVSGTAYVPTTTISAAPTGGGTSYEAVNLLTPKRINTFIGDGTATQFKVDATDLDETAVTAEVNGSAVTVSAVNRSTGLVTLAAAPANGNGLANVSIAFAKTVSGHADKINKCRFAGLYGGKNDTRVFLSGNPDEPDCDWQSGLYDPTYFPDTGYTRMGTDASAIVGYLKQYESQVVVKSGGAQEATSYLRTYMMADDGSALYPLKQGAQGEGAISSRCFAVLNDLPLYLSARGVQGVYGTAVAEQRTIRSVSDAIVPKLSQEADLKNACAVVFEGKYYLAVNGHIYVADGSLAEENGDPAPTLPLSDWSRFKTVRDVIPTLMPHSRSGATVQYENENGAQLALSRNMDLFSFRTLDFSRFSFRCIPGAVTYRTRWKQHRSPLFAVRIGNDRPDEPFGLLALTIRWTQGQTVI